MSTSSWEVHAAPEQGHSMGLSPVLTAATGSVQGRWSLASGGGRVAQEHLGQHKLILTHTCPDLSR